MDWNYPEPTTRDPSSTDAGYASITQIQWYEDNKRSLPLSDIHLCRLSLTVAMLALLATLGQDISTQRHLAAPTVKYPSLSLEQLIPTQFDPGNLNIGGFAQINGQINGQINNLKLDVSSVAISVEHPVKTAHTLLARITAYSGGDRWSCNKISSTGVTLHPGVCAVDPKVIPYFATVDIPNIGKFKAVDTGTAVINRKAARLSASSSDERAAIVVDVYFPTERQVEAFEKRAPEYVAITWYN